MLTFIRQRDCSIYHLRAVRKKAVLLSLMLFVSISAWAQDLSGTYHIANNNNNHYNPASTSTNWYLCPAEYYYNSSNSSATTTPNETPFITTYQLFSTAYTNPQPFLFEWQLEKVGDFYRIINIETGKYVVHNNKVLGEQQRLRVHLETINNPEDNDNLLFEIANERTPNSDGQLFYTIRPKSVSSGQRFLTPSGGNKPNFVPPSGAYLGILGLYDKIEDGTLWHLEPIVAQPQFTENEDDGYVTISCATSGATIYYACNISSPVYPDDYDEYTGGQISTTDNAIVKAIAVKDDLVSNTASFYSYVCDDPVITNNYTDNNTFTITSSTPGATIYYTTDGSKPKKSSSSITSGGSFNWTESMTTIRAFAGNVADTRDSKEVTYDIPKCETPAAQFDANGKIVLSSAQVNGPDNTTVSPKIRYKVDGNAPTRTNGSVYQNPFELVQGRTTVKAVAYSPGYLTSNLLTFTPPRCANPVISYDQETGQLSIRTTTNEATIYYTINDGSVNTVNSSSVTVSEGLQHGQVVCAWAGKNGMSYSEKVLYTLVIQCNAPTFVYAGGLLSIQTSTQGASIYYVIGGNADPTDQSDPYGQPIANLTAGVTVRAIAYKSGMLESEVSVFVTPTEISSLDEITDMSGSYILSDNFSYSATKSGTFSGTLDGQYIPISGSTVPLFEALNSATIKNIILDGVNISGGTNAGAIAIEATGDTRIYNCGVTGTSTISGSGAVGSIVGVISGNTRVINCYSYANVSGGTYAAGIVGQNNGDASTGATGTRIANCTMYGTVAAQGTNRSPVYAGNHTNNIKNFSEYNYYRYISNPDPENRFTDYNDQLAVEKDEYLARFPIYRHILNNHRELAAFFLFGVTDIKNLEDWQINEIGHWYLSDDADFPIVERWESNTKRVPIDDSVTPDNLLADCGNSGYLSVTVNIGASSFSASLPITGTDEDHYDYTWGNVVLPFANEFEGWNRDYSKICTGWKITKVDNETSAQVTDYNFADRTNKNKDIYDATANPYVFAQGGNYIVPYGVKSITIEANFANAFYLSDPAYDIGYSQSYTQPVYLGGTVRTSYHGQPVYTSLPTLLADMAVSTDPNSQAIVLVGNFHYNQSYFGSNQGGFNSYLNKALTIMSADEDNNQEPDYGWYCYHSSATRTPIPPIRFDFLPNIGMGMAARVNGSIPNPTIAIWNVRGWFEITETCVSIMTQCEIESNNFNADDNGKGNNRWIVNSGYFTQIVRAKSANCLKLSYIQIGGNAYVKELYPGSHSDNARIVKLVPIVVTGGEINECYMTGYKAGGTVQGENIRFYCAGGYLHKFLGMNMEGPQKENNIFKTVNMTAKIDHAKIDRFFGGGTSAAAPITGNIDVTIDNSTVQFYCGGPEFGDMVAGKTVTTTARNTTFGEFYGAGYGGTSITYNREEQVESTVTAEQDKAEFQPAFTNYTNNRLVTKASYGIGTCYKFEYIQNSQGKGGLVARFFTGYAQFSLATTGNVTNNLTGCTIQNNFYGAGCQGKVAGTVTSTLTDCNVMGSAFGGGYKAQSNNVDVYPTTQPTYSEYIKQMGIFTEFGTVAPETYTWSNSISAPDQTNKLLNTSVNMNDLGNVTGAISITINGSSVINQNVYGGGNESPSRSNTSVLIEGSTSISGQLYGGGNQALVDGDVTVNIGKANGSSNVIIQGDVYGGGALANTNTSNRTMNGQVETINLGNGSKKTEVNLYPGSKIFGDVYGGGRGQIGNDTQEDIEAIVYGNVSVYQLGAILVPAYSEDGLATSGRIFGCNNINGTPKGHVLVYVDRTTPNNQNDKYALSAVYGGGNRAAYIPAKISQNDSENTEVVINGCNNVTIHSIYGGGNAASTPATHVRILGAKEIEFVYGGGNGAGTIDGNPNPGANVGYKAYPDSVAGADQIDERAEYIYGSGLARTEVSGGKINHLYGGSNTKGNVRMSTIAQLEELGQCPLEIGEIYGGGREAYMEGKARLELGCMTGMDEIYGGSEKADVGDDIELTITSGTFRNVFGGNNKGGRIFGSITVNIEQTGCLPINIENLYLGGNNAPYSVYGYEETTHDVTLDGETITHYDLKVEGETAHHDPQLNIRSFETIGTVYGGGNGEMAVMVGSPNVDINITEGWVNGEYTGQSAYKGAPQMLHGIGVIGTVFGGGNEAKVIGDTYIFIGDKANDPITLKSMTKLKEELDTAPNNTITEHGITTTKTDNGITYTNAEDPTKTLSVPNSQTVIGAIITGNVYGGGNNADVTGCANVQLGGQ